MPPAKARTTLEDSRSEASTNNIKQAAAQSAVVRGKRNGATGAPNGSHLRAVVSNGAGATAASSHSGQATQNGASGISWASQSEALLDSYRTLYHLPVPSSFRNPLAHVILESGIGKYSPTMARRKNKRRITKDQLALAIRKNFNAQAVSENDVVRDFLYKVKMQDKAFTLKFGPHKSR